MNKFKSSFGGRYCVTSKKSFFSQIATASLVFASRFIGFWPNFSPLGSLGFFSSNPVWFLANIIIFDLVKGGFYRGFFFTYLGFAVYWLLGRLARTTKLKLILLPLSSFLFFLISNFGVWFFWYEHSWVGLATCYAVAVPFYKMTLLGDLCFGYSFLLWASLRRHGLSRVTMLHPLPILAKPSVFRRTQSE